MTRRVMVLGVGAARMVASFDKMDVNGERFVGAEGGGRGMYVIFVSGEISSRFVRSNE